MSIEDDQSDVCNEFELLMGQLTSSNMLTSQALNNIRTRFNQLNNKFADTYALDDDDAEEDDDVNEALQNDLEAMQEFVDEMSTVDVFLDKISQVEVVAVEIVT